MDDAPDDAVFKVLQHLELEGGVVPKGHLIPQADVDVTFVHDEKSGPLRKGRHDADPSGQDPPAPFTTMR
jgi:hypothetical protein